MDTPPWKLFGATPRRIAAGLAIRPELVLTYMSSILGGLAGAFARLHGLLGETHRPALPLVLAERHSSKGRSLEQLGIEPVWFYSDWERRKMQALDPNIIERQGERVKSNFWIASQNLMAELDKDFQEPDRMSTCRSELIRHRQRYQPSVMLSSPSPESFEEVRGSVFDESPLIVDPGGRIIRNSITPGPAQRDWQVLLERIVEGARGGTDQPAGLHSPETASSVRRTMSPFLFHLPQDAVPQAILHPAASTLFEVGLLLPTEGLAGGAPSIAAGIAEAGEAVQRYQNAVNDVLWSRMDNSGVDFALQQASPEWIDGQHEINDRIDALPPAVRRHCGGLVDLPHRLLWTAMILDDPSAKHASTLLPGVLHTARWCVERQVALITETLEAEQRREREEAAWRMLVKLGELRNLPCKFADLARKYSRQRKDQLEPVLRFLSQEGLVRWESEDNRIDLLPCNPPPEWVEVRQRCQSDGLAALT